jgi:hypothetical protein
MILTASKTAILVAAHTPHSAQSSINPWVVVVTASVIITVVGGAIGILSYVSRYGQRKVERRVNQIVQAQLDAEDAEQNKQKVKQELNRLREAKEKLEEEIRQVPKEANRLFLEKQLKELADSISKDFSEFKSVEAKLRSEQVATTLDPQIREAIETGMLPIRRQQERRNTYVLLILVALLALNLSPVSVSYYVNRYFSVFANSPYWTADAPAWMPTFGALVVAFVFFCLSSLSPGIQKYVARLERTIFMVAVGTLFVAAIALGYYLRSAALSTLCYPYCFPLRDTNGASISFNVASILGGLMVFLILDRRPKILSVFSIRRGRPPSSTANLRNL